MKLVEFAQNIKHFAEKYPNLEVVFSKDDEGNGFSRIFYSPSLGLFEDGEFSTQCEIKEINAICIN